MAGAWMRKIPNALTITRIGLSAVVFFVLMAAAGAAEDDRSTLLILSAGVFVVAALTDFFDGWLARKLQVVSVWGAILDPIADKIAIAAAILGLTLLEPRWGIAAPGFLILFREMFVSGLREGIAPRGIKLPVTLLAKWKTTVQLLALTMEMLAATRMGAPEVQVGADVLLWVAAALTLWTGWEYSRGAARALR